MKVQSVGFGSGAKSGVGLETSLAVVLEDTLEHNVRSLVPDAAVVEVGTIRDCVGDLFPEEFRLVRDAAQTRQFEFSTGRACARTAMQRLGVRPGPILRSPNRSPAWPCGVVGSISHSHDLCITAVAKVEEVGALGIDIERLGEVDRTMFPLICSPEEFESAAALPDRLAELYVTLLFSAKEALYKCNKVIELSRLDFRDVQIKTFGQSEGSSQMYAVHERGSDISHKGVIGRWRLYRDYVITAFHTNSQMHGR